MNPVQKNKQQWELLFCWSCWQGLFEKEGEKNAYFASLQMADSDSLYGL